MPERKLACPASEVSRDGIGSLDVEGAAMVCVSYLGIGGSPARLRQRLSKGIPILVGSWPAADSALSDKAIQTAIGADYSTGSLGQSVTSCVEAARKLEASDQAKAAA